jgi:hypothetical protein
MVDYIVRKYGIIETGQIKFDGYQTLASNVTCTDQDDPAHPYRLLLVCICHYSVSTSKFT